jgi:hypothetical protein
MYLPFFDFFAAVGCIWSAIEMSAREKHGTRQVIAQASEQHLNECITPPKNGYADKLP